ncbi:MAG TPA: recombinase family protein [Oligoflexus sp.]|uniref:recombinase family protein n=1 Tax=Oligoflexus sp. TaxID=1971216 RepID=UPI002D3CDCC6|nr:recombinase family protein [Oligoflexus sp.]HYX34132.1 recombinase family protein [Oligoflexus sp.]
MNRKARRATSSVINKVVKNVFKGAFYGRVSTIDQAFEVDGSVRADGSTEAQQTRCFYYVDHLTQKTGVLHKLVEFITDLAFSGKNTKRPGFQKLWKLIEDGEIDFVIAAELSRLSRSVADFLAFLAHCEKHGVAVFIVGLDLDTSSPFGRMMIVVLVALAQFERETTAVRVRENAAARLLQDGKINGSAEILGLDRDPHRKGHYIKNLPELHRLVQHLKLYILHRSKQKVLSEAKRLGIKGKRDKDLTPFMLEQALFNCKWRYRGLWFANLENEGENDQSLPASKKFQVVSLPHGPLIDLELLDQVQRILDDPARKNKRAGSRDYVYMLSHILFHDPGVSRYTGASAKSAAHRYYYAADKKLRIRCEEIDPIVLEALKSHLLESDRFQALVARAVKGSGSGQGPDLKNAVFDLLKSFHQLPVAALRSIVETLVKRVVVGDDHTLTIELFEIAEDDGSQRKQPSTRKRRPTASRTPSKTSDGGLNQ